MEGEDSLFRAALPEPVEEVSTPRRDDEPLKVYPNSEMPPSLYHQAHKDPLVMQVLGVGASMSSPDVRPIAMVLDRYINDEVTRLNMPDTAESYTEIVERAMKELGLKEDSMVSVKLEKLLGFLQSQSDLARALKRKQDIMEGDPLEMSSAKLKMYLKIRHNIETV